MDVSLFRSRQSRLILGCRREAGGERGDVGGGEGDDMVEEEEEEEGMIWWRRKMGRSLWRRRGGESIL